MAEKKVVVYSTPTCPYCKRAKDYLSRKGISYVDYNVAQDKDKAREMIQKSGQMGVPVITIDNEVVVGFNQAWLDRLLSQ
jgi:glutaredoxin 3